MSISHTVPSSTFKPMEALAAEFKDRSYEVISITMVPKGCVAVLLVARYGSTLEDSPYCRMVFVNAESNCVHSNILAQ